jgi:hypothetical protein
MSLIDMLERSISLGAIKLLRVARRQTFVESSMAFFTCPRALARCANRASGNQYYLARGLAPNINFLAHGGEGPERARLEYCLQRQHSLAPQTLEQLDGGLFYELVFGKLA